MILIVKNVTHFKELFINLGKSCVDGKDIYIVDKKDIDKKFEIDILWHEYFGKDIELVQDIDLHFPKYYGLSVEEIYKMNVSK